MATADLNNLIRSASSGNPAALEALATRFQKMILVNCSLRLDDASQVEDIAQEVSEQMITGITQLKNPAAFTAWLDQIITRTCNRCNHQSRSRQAREVMVDISAPDGWVDGLMEQDESQIPEASFARNQAHAVLLFHIQSLPPAQRVPLLLYYFGALNYRQIAELLHVQIGTVSSNIAKGKRNLNRRLLEED